MYLPWTVTFPIMIGGAVFKYVDGRSRARGDSDETRQSVVHRGLLFSSGLVAGEAIMGIVIAILIVAGLNLPLLTGWLQTGWMVNVVSLLGFSGVILLLVRKALR
jgi:uncharacterized oligopeptide transporter (OPT) family protein